METQELIASLALAQEAAVTQVDLTSESNRIIIDMDTRKVTIKDSFGNEYDHLAKTMILDITRYVGDVDLSTKTAALHWENGDNGGVYPLTEMDLSESGKVLYKWPISDDFTQNSGTIVFAVHIYSIVDGAFTYHISSDAQSGRLGKTLNASDHAAKTMSPSKIEECIQTMMDISAEIDAQVAKVTAILGQAETAATNAEISAAEAANAAEAALDKKADAIVQTLSGTTAVATDSAKAGLHGLRLFGKTDAVPYEVTNLLNIGVETQTINGITFTVNKDGTITANGTATAQTVLDLGATVITEPGSYVIGGCPANGAQYTYGLSGAIGRTVETDGSANTTIENYADYGDSYAFTMGASITRTRVTMFLGINSGVTVSNLVFAPMIMTEADYKYYSGEGACPSPSYPQELVSVGDEGSVEVGVYGKNLLENTLEAQTTYGLTIKKSDDGVLNITGTTTAEVTRYIFNDAVNPIHNDKGAFIKGAKSINGIHYKAKISNGEKVIYSVIGTEGLYIAAGYNIYEVYIQQLTTGTTVSAEIEPQILVGDADSTYEPYTEQTLTVQTPNGLPGIPLGATIPDVIANSPALMSGVWWDDETEQYYISDTVECGNGVYVQRVGEVPPDAVWYDVGVNNNTTDHRYTTYVDAIRTQHCTVMCSHLVQLYKTSSWEAGDYIATDEMVSQNGRICIRFTETKISTVEELKKWISDNSVKIQYILATPIEIPLTDEEIAAYKALHSNKPTTIITNDAGCFMEVEYVADTKTHIEQNYVPVTAFNDVLDRISALEQLHV